MTKEDQIRLDRMRYTKDKFSSNLVLLAIVLDALYFISIYKTDVGTYYYNWVIGASIVYNLLFMLGAFLASEGVKNRKSGYTALLIILGLIQIVRIFYLPAKARGYVVLINEVENIVMNDSQYYYVVICLALSAVCCVVAAVSSAINNKKLAEYMRSLEIKTV